jgi:hypothetical protein
MRRLGIFTALLTLLTAVSVSVALAIEPGTYTPTSDSFDSANAPGSSHLAKSTSSCTVNPDLSIDCSAYVLGGVGQTNATVSLVASYTATIDCNNPGNNRNNPIESHTAAFAFRPAQTALTNLPDLAGVPDQPACVSSSSSSCLPSRVAWPSTGRLHACVTLSSSSNDREPAQRRRRSGERWDAGQ